MTRYLAECSVYRNFMGERIPKYRYWVAVDADDVRAARRELESDGTMRVIRFLDDPWVPDM